MHLFIYKFILTQTEQTLAVALLCVLLSHKKQYTFILNLNLSDLIKKIVFICP